LQPDEYVFLTRSGTLWSWPGQNPFKYRDPSGRDGDAAFLRFAAYVEDALPYVAAAAAQSKVPALSAAGAAALVGLEALNVWESVEAQRQNAEALARHASNDGNVCKIERVSPVINPADVAGGSPAEIDQLAREAGLIPRGPNPEAGNGAYIDPVTREQRVLIYTEPGSGVGHAHVNHASGKRLGIDGQPVDPESKDAHLPLGSP